MNDITKIDEIEDKITIIRDERVIIDSDLAKLYGVETRDINKAVKNNPNKFPEGYFFELTKEEFDILRGKFSTSKFSKTRTNPKAFTEKGLYMLATILKGNTATQTTISIIEVFAKIKDLSRNIKDLSKIKDEKEKKMLMQKSEKLIAEIIEDDLSLSETETTIELNFAVLKFKHTVKRK